MFADPSTFFVKFRYIEDGQAKTRFVNCHAWLAMGTAEQAEMGKTTQLFSMGDPNISLTHDTKKVSKKFDTMHASSISYFLELWLCLGFVGTRFC